MEEGKKEITITYETLFELLKREKDRDELQKLHDSFYSDVLEYLKEKNKILEAQQTSLDLFSSAEKDKTIKELGNIKRILTELYEKREKKIIDMALNKSKIESNIVDTAALLKQEKKFFDEIVVFLNRYREGVLYNILNAKDALVEKAEIVEEKGDEEKDVKIIRFLSAIPKFLGKELEVYGPYDEDDIASLPIEIANVLIRKERAEEVKEE